MTHLETQIDLLLISFSFLLYYEIEIQILRLIVRRVNFGRIMEL
jgi:hypothetical protein